MEHDLLSQVVSGHDYAVIRQSGTQAKKVCLQLNLSKARGARLERMLQRRVAAGLGDEQLPKFARHDQHVAEVMAAGGFWALSERRVGKDGVSVCLPLIAPERT